LLHRDESFSYPIKSQSFLLFAVRDACQTEMSAGTRRNARLLLLFLASRMSDDFPTLMQRGVKLHEENQASMPETGGTGRRWTTEVNSAPICPATASYCKKADYEYAVQCLVESLVQMLTIEASKHARFPALIRHRTVDYEHLL
jgi:hypothetical protein